MHSLVYQHDSKMNGQGCSMFSNVQCPIRRQRTPLLCGHSIDQGDAISQLWFVECAVVHICARLLANIDFLMSVCIFSCMLYLADTARYRYACTSGPNLVQRHLSTSQRSTQPKHIRHLSPSGNNEHVYEMHVPRGLLRLHLLPTDSFTTSMCPRLTTLMSAAQPCCMETDVY